MGGDDHRGGAELALLNRDTFRVHDAKTKAEPYQKRKVDRQIIAICKVYGVTELYTDDKELANRARMCGITPISISEVPIPEAAKQIPLDLDPHEPIPEANDAG